MSGSRPGRGVARPAAKGLPAVSAKPSSVRDAAAPVFVQSSWRTGSTWLWARLRAAPTTIAYCEVFHERLGSFTVGQLRRDDYSTWNSKHPESAPYFLEFSPFVSPDRGAARGYDARMAFEWFVPQEGLGGPLREEERVYLEGLIAAAAERGKVPVLTDTRTLGRFTAIARAFPGHHVLLVRNLFHQWASYSEQWAHGNRYFFDTFFATVEAAARVDPFARVLFEWFETGDRSPANVVTFQLFLIFHLHLYLHAYDAATLVVDVNRVASDATERARVEAALGAAVGAPVGLADARAPFGLSLFTVGSKAAFVDTIEQFFKLAIDGSVSVEAARFAARAKDDALLEWERCEFYGGGARAWFRDRLKRAEAEASPALPPAASVALAAPPVKPVPAGAAAPVRTTPVEAQAPKTTAPAETPPRAQRSAPSAGAKNRAGPPAPANGRGR